MTERWNDWIANAEENLSRTAHPRINITAQVLRAQRYGNYVINYMNSEDLHHEWAKFKGYIGAQDRYHGTNVLDVYPEYKPYWT